MLRVELLDEPVAQAYDGLDLRACRGELGAKAADVNVDGSGFDGLGVSASAAGVSVGAAYKRRRNDPGFAQAWDQAIDMGYCELEAALIQNARTAVLQQTGHQGTITRPEMFAGLVREFAASAAPGSHAGRVA